MALRATSRAQSRTCFCTTLSHKQRRRSTERFCGRNLGREPAVGGGKYDSERKRGTVRYVIMRNLDHERFAVNWSSPNRKGSFGLVYFGIDNEDGDGVVIKCPARSSKARSLWNVEEHVNSKLDRLFGKDDFLRWPKYMGRIDIPSKIGVSSAVQPVGLVWRMSGNGETLEDFLNGNRVSDLDRIAARTGAICTAWTGSLRVQLAERVLLELILLLVDLNTAGIIHRDIKPENLIVDGACLPPLRCVDFGSSCDWGSPLKVGLRTATCDPIYAAPERTLNIMAANKYDVYSVGLIVLRCLFPSLTSSENMEQFVRDELRSHDSFENFLDAVSRGRAGKSTGVGAEALLFDSESELEPLRSLLCAMLETKASSRADGSY